jgi:hypothetical protein
MASAAEFMFSCSQKRRTTHPLNSRWVSAPRPANVELPVPWLGGGNALGSRQERRNTPVDKHRHVFPGDEDVRTTPGYPRQWRLTHQRWPPERRTVSPTASPERCPDGAASTSGQGTKNDNRTHSYRRS